MHITEDDLDRLIGTEQYRNTAVREALSEGRAAYGPVRLHVDLESSMLTVDGPFFETVFDLQTMKQTNEGASVKDVRQHIDNMIREQTQEHITEAYW
jgi:hypothetical protein